MMKKRISLLGFFIVIFALSVTAKDANYAWLENAIDVAQYQLKYQTKLVDELRRDTVAFPRSIRNGQVRLVHGHDWTSGFFPGNLWLAYELTKDASLEYEARKYTNMLSPIQYYKGTHDLGFMMYCSYGQALRLSKKEGDEETIVSSANSLISRFNPVTKTIRSWDFGKWSYPVIIDNMMNLEMLFWASKYTNDPKYRDIAIVHANTTLKNHFRKDHSSYHVISYDINTGKVESKGTFQGYSDSSTWARGQSWGLYGYTLCYRETKDKAYLKKAEAIAKLIMTHKNTPEDLIPYWDYDAPDIPNAPRDASTAAVFASALIELSYYSENKDQYIDYAERLLKSLSSEAYLAKKGENKGFVLLHSVGNLPNNSEIDTPLNYADYYYLEALIRYIELKKIKL